MERDKYQKVHYSFVPLPKTTTWVANCNTVTFWNQGTQNVTIAGAILLTPGQAFTFECYPGEMITQSFDIVFTNDSLPGCKLIAVCKIYVS